jgi:hypothetical protein
MRFPFDPTLVPLPDGRVRLYFTSLRGRRFDEDLPAIYSAVSTNGIDYTVEPGRRFGIEGRHVIDCAVVLHDGVFHLFAPDNGPQPGPGQQMNPNRPPDGAGYHATSADGLMFTRVDDVRVDGRRRWLGNAQSDGTVITFFGTGDPGPPGPPGTPRGGVWMATSRDGRAWQLSGTLTVAGADPGAVAAKAGGWIVAVTGPPRGGDPAPVRLNDGTWLMLVKSFIGSGGSLPPWPIETGYSPVSALGLSRRCAPCRTWRTRTSSALLSTVKKTR